MLRIKGGRYFLPALIKSLLLPLVFTYSLIHLAHPSMPWLSQAFLYSAALPLLYHLRCLYSVFRSDAAARRCGASPTPRVKGRYPLNIDVLLDWAKSGSEEEVGRMMVLLSREYGSTYNTKVLGEDQVGLRLRFHPDPELSRTSSRSSRLIRASSSMPWWTTLTTLSRATRREAGKRTFLAMVSSTRTGSGGNLCVYFESDAIAAGTAASEPHSTVLSSLAHPSEPLHSVHPA